MAKRVGVNLLHNSNKRGKFENSADIKLKVRTGHSSNLTVRELKLFDAITKLVTKDTGVPTICDRSNFQSKDGSSLFMEFDTEKEDLNLWLQANCISMKFLLHPVYIIGALKRHAKHPLISFSQNFVDSEDWRLTKSALSVIFGEGSNDAENPDYVYAFSRRSNFIHLRIYQILSLPNSSTQKKKLELSGLCEHICLLPMSFPPYGMNEVKVSETIDLVEDTVLTGIHSSVLHVAHLRGSDLHFALDDPVDLSDWYGFSTCLTDFRERNAILLPSRLIGSTPPTTDSLNEIYMEIIRSLLINMCTLFRKGLCFYKLEETDVFLRGTTVQLSWKLMMLGHDTAAARMNYRNVRDIISSLFSGVVMPPDITALLELLSCDHLTPGDYICNHSSLMNDISKGHMVTDIYFEFTTTLYYRHRAFIAEALLHLLKKWRKSCQSNKLLKGVLDHNHGASESPDQPLECVTEPDSVDIPFVESVVSVEPVAALDSSVVELPSEVIDGKPMMAKAMVDELWALVTTLRHGRMHIADQFKKMHNKSSGTNTLQLRETMRIITSALPEVLYMLQHELRNIVGDKWFAKYFTHQ